MGKGWLDFRSGAQRERDYREFYERVFPGGISHRRRVRARLLEMMQKKGDITDMLLYYTALKDLLIRRPGLSFEEGLKQVCSEVRVMKLDDGAKEVLRKVLEEDLAGQLNS